MLRICVQAIGQEKKDCKINVVKSEVCDNESTSYNKSSTFHKIKKPINQTKKRNADSDSKEEFSRKVLDHNPDKKTKKDSRSSVNAVLASVYNSYVNGKKYRQEKVFFPILTFLLLFFLGKRRDTMLWSDL